MTHPEILDFLADRIARKLPKMGKTMLFCASVEAANYIVDKLRKDKRVGDGLVSLVHSRMEDREIAELEEADDEIADLPERPSQQTEAFDEMAFLKSVTEDENQGPDPKQASGIHSAVDIAKPSSGKKISAQGGDHALPSTRFFDRSCDQGKETAGCMHILGHR
ncbi:hypothetical protein IH922_08740, partial [candidate division KSB1 bacterium]|nr:hypothetical protein [candidate division KSB1 bacterium]